MSHKTKTPERYLVVDPCQISASYNFCLLDGLAKQGARVTYACSKYVHEDIPPPEGVDRLCCFFFIATLVQRIYPSQRIRRILRAAEYPFDILALIGYILVKRIKVVHFMWSLSPTFDRWLFKLLQRFGCRLVYTAHNPFPHERKASHERKFSRLYQSADHLIVLTQNTANEILRVCEIPLGRISVVPHGDFEALHSEYPCDDDLVQKVAKKAAGRKVIAFLGLIRPYKGLDYFVEAFPLILRQMPDALFLVAGSVAIGDEDKIRSNIAANCGDEHLWVDIRYLPISALKAYVKAMDVLVMPYLAASQSGNTVMAYSAGVPVIATDVGGLAEMTTDNETGFVIPPKDSQAIADAVCKCFEGDAYETMSTRAKDASTNEYSWSTIAKQTISVYDAKVKP